MRIPFFFVARWRSNLLCRPFVSDTRFALEVNMGIFVLFVKIEMEGIARLKFADGARWCVSLENLGERKDGVYICPDEEVDVEGGRGVANFVMKWPESKRQCNISIIELKDFTRNEYLEGDNGEFVPIVAFECRGCDIVDFTFQDPFTVESEGGFVFEDVELEDGEWADYDEENDLSVMITSAESKIESHSGKGGKGGKGKKKRS